MSKMLRLAVTVVILTALFWKISFTQVIGVLQQTNGWALLATIPLVALLYVFRTAKWQMMLRTVGIRTPFFYNYKNVLKGIFYSLATPGRAGELGRALLFERKEVVFATVVWEKVTDALLVVLLCFLSLAVLFRNGTLFWLTGASGIAVVSASIVLMHGKSITLLTHLFSLATPTEYLTQVNALARDISLNVKMLLPSLIYYLVAYGIAFIVLHALNPMLPKMLVFSLPIIILLGNLPISFSGIGVREMVTSVTFQAMGADPASGASYGFLLFVVFTLFPGLIGGVLHHLEA